MIEIVAMIEALRFVAYLVPMPPFASTHGTGGGTLYFSLPKKIREVF